jgi:hypothetical protein
LPSLELECFSLCTGYRVVFEADVVFPSYVSYLCVLGFDFWWWFMVVWMADVNEKVTH